MNAKYFGRLISYVSKFQIHFIILGACSILILGEK